MRVTELKISHFYPLSVLILATLVIVSCGKDSGESPPRMAQLDASIEVYGTEVEEQSSGNGEIDPDWGFEMDIVNAKNRPLRDVFITLKWMDSGGKEESGERRFVGQWDAGERITFPRPFTGTSIQGPTHPEKVKITVESGGKLAQFVLYKLPGPKRSDKVVPERI